LVIEALGFAQGRQIAEVLEARIEDREIEAAMEIDLAGEPLVVGLLLVLGRGLANLGRGLRLVRGEGAKGANRQDEAQREHRGPGRHRFQFGDEHGLKHLPCEIGSRRGCATEAAGQE
jgi:hypothetical protein